MKKFTLFLIALTLMGSLILTTNSIALPGNAPLACDAPVNFWVQPPYASSSLLLWNAPATVPALGYYYEVRQGSTIVGFGTTLNLYAIVNGLSPSTAYTAYARSVCAAGDSSTWVNYSFTTGTCTFATIPYSDNIESYPVGPVSGCLKAEDANNDAVTWIVNTGVPYSGTKKLFSGRSANALKSMNDWLYTQALSLEGGHSYTVKFRYRAASITYFEKLRLNWGSAPYSSAMTGGVIFDTTFNYTAGYLLGKATFVPSSTGNYWVGFQCYSDALKAGVYLDDISVCEGPYIADPITGPSTICSPATGQTYSIPAVPVATSYTWSVPAGATITSPTNSNSITVDFNLSAVSGNITVYASNTCGNSNTVTKAVTIGGNLPVSVSIAAVSSTVCSGDSAHFTATIVNGGTAPTYQWKNYGVDISGATNSTFGYIPVNGDSVTCVVNSNLPCQIGSPATSNAIIMTVNSFVPVSVSISASANPSCAGDSVTFTTVVNNGGTNPAYQWRLNGNNIPGATNATYKFPPSNLNRIRCVVTSSKPCVTGNPATSNQIIMVVSASPVVSVTVVALTNNVCVGSSITMLAVPINGGISPVFQWYVNDTLVPGVTGLTFTYTPQANDTVHCRLFSSRLCKTGNPATSNSLYLNILPLLPVSVSIIESEDTVCAGTQVTFTATPVNGGGLPVYRWYNNTTLLSLTTNPSFTYTPANGDMIHCVMNSTEQCTTGNPATSNTIPMVVNPLLPVSISIAESSDSVCKGQSVTFNASTVNGGPNPQFQWKLGINDIPLANDSVYTYIPANGDTISCVLTSNAICPTGNPATSNPVIMTVTDSIFASVSIVADTTAVCEGGIVNFTATPVNGGATPSYVWFVNDLVYSGPTGPTFSLTPVNGDVINCVMQSSETTCIGGNPATSNDVTLTVHDSVYVGVSIESDVTEVCEDGLVNFTATPVNGGLTPLYTWYVNDTVYPGFTGAAFSFAPLNGDNVKCMLQSSETVCVGGNPATSNVIALTVHDSIYVSLSIESDVTEICEDGLVNFTATPVNGGLTPLYTWYVNDTVYPGFTGAAFSFAPLNGDKVKCVLQSSETTCVGGNPASSNEIAITVHDSIHVSLSIESDVTELCEDGIVNFTATPVNGGLTPLYTWYVNDTVYPGFTGAAFSFAPLNGDNVKCMLQSSETVCVGGNPATSNVVALTVHDSIYVSLSIESDVTEICEDGIVNFTATPVNGGLSPLYTWYVNDTVYPGFTGAAFSFAPLNGDKVKCILQSSETTCVGGNPASSNEIAITVHDSIHVSLSIESDVTELCEDGIVNFTATPVNGGLTPLYTWYVNDTVYPGFTGAAFSFAPLNGDNVKCMLQSSETVCVGGNPATSNVIALTVHDSIYVSLSIESDVTEICEDGIVNFTATPVNGGLSPLYTWYVNDTVYPGFTGAAFSFTPLNGDKVKCILQSSETTCVGGNPASSNEIAITVHDSIHVSLSIESDVTELCEDGIVNFTATPVNGGVSPVYTWYVNDLVYTGPAGPTFSLTPLDGDVVKCTLLSSETTCVGGNPATSNSVALTVHDSIFVSVSIESDVTEICEDGIVNFTATPVNGGLSPLYTWYVNDTVYPGFAGSAFSFAPLNGDKVKCILQSSETTCVGGNPASSNEIAITVHDSIHVSLSIESDVTELCEDGIVNFTATPVNGGLSPLYTWYVNDTVYPGFTGSAFSFAPLNGDQVKCLLLSSETTCVGGNPATSGSIGLIVNPLLPVSVTIKADTNNVCDGSKATLTATPVNGGNNPVYKWFVNEVEQPGETTETFSFYPSDADAVRCGLTSNSTDCITGNPASSNVVTITIEENHPVELYIEPSANFICEGTEVTFTATGVNEGDAPIYQWIVNDVPVNGQTNFTYTYTPASFDRVTCILTSSLRCTANNPAATDTIVMNVFPYSTLSATISATSSEVCDGVSVTFTVYPVNAGLLPGYQWKKNGSDILNANDSVYEYVPANGDQISCVVTSYGYCKQNNPAISDTITMVVNPILPVSIEIAVDTNSICEGGTVNFTSTVVNPGVNPTYQWRVNGNNIPATDQPTFSLVPVNGDIVTCVLTSSEAKCVQNNPDTSNAISLTVTPYLTPAVTIVASANPSLSGNPVTFTATPENEGTQPIYQWFVNGSSKMTGTSPTYTYNPVMGDKVHCIMTSNYPCVTGNQVSSNEITMLVANIPLVLYIENITITPGEQICYDALSTIVVAGDPYKFTIEPGGNVTMIAGHKIRIKDGTKVLPGGYLHAYISNVFCPLHLPTIPVNAMGEEEQPQQIASLSFIIYPNPTNGNFTIAQKGDLFNGDLSVEVYSMRGERVLNQSIIGEKSHEFMFGDAQPGLYFVKIYAGDHVETFKLVKTR